jgi:hypothetical protein
MPKAGEIFLLSNGNSLGVQVDTTGENMVWDYSDLTFINQNYDTMLAKKNLPPAYQFLFLSSSYAQRLIQNISVDTFFSLTNVYNIYKNSASKFEQTAFAGEFKGFPVPTYVSPTDVWYNFPMNYADSSISNSGYSFSVPPLVTPPYIYFKQNRERKNKVDGWGKLILPMDTFDVLRVKSTLTDKDTVSFFGFGLPSITIVSYEYKFLGTSKGLPLLQINASDIAGTIVPTSVTYQDTLHPIFNYVEEKKSSLPFISFPNPANSLITIITDEGNQFSIFDLSGRILMEQPIHSRETIIDTKSLSDGIYFLAVSNKDKRSITQKLIIAH